VLLAELLGKFGGDTDKSFGDIRSEGFWGCFTFLCFFTDLIRFFYDVEVLMGRNCGWGVVFFSPIGGDYSAQDLLGDPEKVFFILDFVGAHC
jgi:hypothetical protein